MASRASISLLLAVVACGSAPEAGHPDPGIEQRFLEDQQARRDAAKRDEDFQTLLLNLDQGVAEYVTDLANAENEQAWRRAEAMRKWIEAVVAKQRRNLVPLLQDEEARLRGIAGASLGFDKGTTSTPQTVSALVMALETEKVPAVQSNLCLGLGLLGSASTPLDRLIALAVDSTTPLQVRQSAAWALLELQEAGAPAAQVGATWSRVLEGDIYVKDARLVLNALRGIGLLREPRWLEVVLPYLEHPQPLVRQAALVAVGRLGDRAGARYVLHLLGPQERNPNVRLFARKALQALAGHDVDHQYDWQAWAREFRLSGSPETGFSPLRDQDKDEEPGK
ncbi:MAG: HEAT repeat domain-containing protein [Planctomycetota bacterium]